VPGKRTRKGVKFRIRPADKKINDFARGQTFRKAGTQSFRSKSRRLDMTAEPQGEFL